MPGAAARTAGCSGNGVRVWVWVAGMALLAGALAMKPIPFNCTVPTATAAEPKSIHELGPAHVSIVMAMGDSISAAFAARATLFESRDISWSIGVGTSKHLTLPWLLNQYRGALAPALSGMSTKEVIPKDIAHLPHNDWHESDHLNAAESSGAVHDGSLDEQWAILKKQFGEYPDFDKRWKVLTLWMTANDVCGKCSGPMDTTSWTERTDALLEEIASTMGNVYVNLISTLDLSNVARLQRDYAFCKLEHKYLFQECGCIDRGDSKELEQLDENVHKLNSELHLLARKWYAKLQNRTDMAVVVQGFQEGIGKNLTFSFLNDLDCFHPSAVGHQTLAVALWNSMLCRDRTNSCGMNLENLAVTCPTATSTFYTGPDVIPKPPHHELHELH